MTIFWSRPPKIVMAWGDVTRKSPWRGQTQTAHAMTIFWAHNLRVTEVLKVMGVLRAHNLKVKEVKEVEEVSLSSLSSKSIQRTPP